ncbi:Inositol-pentakisphosphate 2-kinase [Tulasnella sp. JGI-2019a]|nr:Inositol-pentakisphosphate 2-kinase [Tulasnella sp. JGI-2019a]
MTSNTTLSTHYCPLDLYSGEESRVRKALQALCDAWVESDGSLNNLKIFAAGKRVSPSNVCLFLVFALSSNAYDDRVDHH